jgi:uncharacterized damage-inducible protein DinB/predicted RNase H-like HicB family nuclease
VIGRRSVERAMRTYDLYLESGPKMRKTMVHVLALTGCIATGATTDSALAATPAAIRAYLRFLHGIGERVDPNETFETRVAEHITEGEWLGNGSPYLVFAPDLEPATDAHVRSCLRRFHALRETLASWAESRTAKDLDAAPKGGGRTARQILLHVMPSPGGYLSPVIGGAKGFAATQGAAERGEISIAAGLRRVDELAADALRHTTREQRSAVIHRPKDVRTMRRALRRMLEHDWEHLAELARRAGGPAI